MSVERSSSPELTPPLINAYTRTFISRRDCYPIQLPVGTYITVKEPLHFEHLTDHLYGRLTLGAYALTPDSQARWLCLDADDDQEWSALLQLGEVLHNLEVTPYLESSRRGGHLWLFTPSLPGQDMRRFAQALMHQHHIPNTIELYPKQDALTTGPGSLVRLPLGVHRKSGRRYPFIQRNGQPLAPTIRAQMAVLADPQRVPLTFIRQTLAHCPVPQLPQPLHSSKPSKTLAPDAETPVSERIKAAISVREFVSRYVALNDRGVGFCPFHDDTRPSFGVNDQGNYWHCWAGCGGGSVIDFWMKWREYHGQDARFVPTITELAQLLFGD